MFRFPQLENMGEHRSAQYFHGIAANADVCDALTFARCSDVHFAWATALDALAN